MARSFYFRNFCTNDVSTSVRGNLVNLQVIPEAIPFGRNRVPANPGIITVISYDVFLGKTCVPFPTDTSPVQRRSVSIFHDVPPAVPNSIPDQRKRPGNVPESITAVLNSPCEAGKFIPLEWDDASGCRNAMSQERDSCSAQRNSMPFQQNSPPVQRSSMLLVPKSIQVQLSGVSRPTFVTKKARFHQFRHFWHSLPLNHTHRDSHVTMHFIYLLSRRHNAVFNSSQQ